MILLLLSTSRFIFVASRARILCIFNIPWGIRCRTFLYNFLSRIFIFHERLSPLEAIRILYNRVYRAAAPTAPLRRLIIGIRLNFVSSYTLLLNSIFCFPFSFVSFTYMCIHTCIWVKLIISDWVLSTWPIAMLAISFFSPLLWWSEKPKEKYTLSIFDTFHFVTRQSFLC